MLPTGVHLRLGASVVEKDWTVEQVMEAQRQAQANGLGFSDPSGPVSQWDGLHRLDQLERQFTAGDEAALLEAIAVCARHDLVIPEWAAVAYLRAYLRVIHFETDSWDVAFGRPHPRGIHLRKAQKRRQLRFQVYNHVRAMLNARDYKWERVTPVPINVSAAVAYIDSYGDPPDIGIGDELFDLVGEEFGIHKTLCSKLYYEVDRLMSLPPKS
jgi:hypothetical protein